MKFRILLIVAGFLTSGSLVAQSNWPSTMLWKISGKGSAKDSYLFGTVHLQDKRLFHFTDSLYHFLEKADGFAMEIDIQAMMDSVMNIAVRKRHSEPEHADSTVAIIDTAMAEIDVVQPPPLPPEFRIADSVAIKPASPRLKTRYQPRKRDEMPTIVDAYLYGVANRFEKWVGGIEDVEDQLSVINELGANISNRNGDDDDDNIPRIGKETAVESIIRIYLKSDLDAIQKYIVDRERDSENGRIFRQRNRKMAQRMDSLSHIRSMFFAVGAAHLPGDSGVISLLRKMGYRVEPVFSKKTIDPDRYLARLPKAKWVDVSDDNNTFSIQMPGTPGNISLGEVLPFKFHLDPTSLTYYMAGSLPNIANIDVDTFFSIYSERSGQQLISTRLFKLDTLEGKEAVLRNRSEYILMRMLNRDGYVFMIMAGGDDRKKLESDDVKRYMASFRPKDNLNRQKFTAPKWVSFDLRQKGCSLLFPAKPRRNKKVESKAEGSNWGFLTYESYDLKKGGYFLLNVRDLEPGFHITDDSATFREIKSAIAEKTDDIVEERSFEFYGFPAYYLKVREESAGLLMALLMVNRGNRMYQIMASLPGGEESDELMSYFIESFRFTDYPEQSGTLNAGSGLGLSVEMPAESILSFEPVEGESLTTNEQVFYLTDTLRAIPYMVYIKPLSPYFWTSDDSTFFNNSIDEFRNWDDSLLFRRTVKKGNLPGMEWLLDQKASHRHKRVAQVVSGDTLYSLVALAPPQYIPWTDAVFTSFRITPEKQPSIYTPRVDGLMQALQSPDSATFEDASEVLTTVEFRETDLPVLHEALLKKYADDSTLYFNSVKRQLIRKIAKFNNPSTISFAAGTYKKLGDEEATIKYQLIDLLSAIHTRESYLVLRDLVVNTPPPANKDDIMSINWLDSLELSRILYPQLFTQLEHSTMRSYILRLTSRLLDEDYLTIDDMQPYKPAIVRAGKLLASNASEMPADEVGIYEFQPIVKILGAFNDSETTPVLTSFLETPGSSLKFHTALLLLDSGRVVPVAVWDKIAEDVYYRRDVYDSLENRSQLKLYPQKYLKQHLLAQSDMFNYAAYDDIPSEVTQLEERTLNINGEKKKVYIFKITYEYTYDSSTASYVGIAGPYDTKDKNMKTDHSLTRANMDDEYSKATYKAIADALIQEAIADLKREREN